MLISDLDDVTADMEIDGELVQRTLHKRVIERGAWATVILQFQKRARSGEWQPARLSVVRFAKVRGAYKRHATIGFGALSVVELQRCLGEWFSDNGVATTDEDEGLADD
jgi:hypothetical protein